MTTRWNSLLIMLRCLQDLKEPVTSSFALLGKVDQISTDNEWSVIINVIACLYPLTRQLLSSVLKTIPASRKSCFCLRFLDATLFRQILVDSQIWQMTFERLCWIKCIVGLQALVRSHPSRLPHNLTFVSKKCIFHLIIFSKLRAKLQKR